MQLTLILFKLLHNGLQELGFTYLLMSCLISHSTLREVRGAGLVSHTFFDFQKICIHSQSVSREIHLLSRLELLFLAGVGFEYLFW